MEVYHFYLFTLYAMKNNANIVVTVPTIVLPGVVSVNAVAMR